MGGVLKWKFESKSQYQLEILWSQFKVQFIEWIPFLERGKMCWPVTWWWRPVTWWRRPVTWWRRPVTWWRRPVTSGLEVKTSWRAGNQSDDELKTNDDGWWWPIEEKAEHISERVCVCGRKVRNFSLTTIIEEGWRIVKQWNEERWEIDLSLQVSRTDVVVEDVLDEFAGLKELIFVYTRNRASFYWKLSKPRRLQRENNYLLLILLWKRNLGRKPCPIQSIQFLGRPNGDEHIGQSWFVSFQFCTPYTKP